MASSTALRGSVSRNSAQLTVLLFSQPDCEFCAEVRSHYLQPLAAARDPTLWIGEAGMLDATPIRDWQDRVVTQRAFADDCGVHYAPTVMFFDARGRSLAPPIVGLSRDYFGAYLEQRIVLARRAMRSGDPR